MKQSVKLVPATPADRATLMALKHQMNLSEFNWRASVGDGAGADDLDISLDATVGPVDRDLAALENGMGGIVLAFIAECPVGYISYAFKQSSTSFRAEVRSYLYVAGLAVEETHRNLGIGAILLEAAAAEAKRHGLDRVMLEVSSVSPAAAFYQREGFSPISQTMMKRLS